MGLDPAGIGQPVAMTMDQEEVDNGECRNLKKAVGVKMESPVSTPAPPPLHLLAPVGNSDISSPCEQIMVRTRSVAVNTADAALATEPECLGPCEPGTSVNLEGIVWQETEDGMLVVNVTWRNKTYVGTLLDCTRHDWAPPRFCESPTSDVEMRSGRGRGKRMRPSSNTPLNDNSNSSDNKGSGSSKTRGAATNSKGRRGSQTAGGAEDVKASPSSAKRKTKPASDMEPTSSSEDTKASKRMRTNSTGATLPLPGGKPDHLPPPQLDRTCPSPVLIDCPHPNCNKKYKHINGLKYHQARAHNDHDVRLDQDVDSEYGDDPALHPDPASCNGAAISPARSTTPKGRGFDAPSPSPGKLTSKGKKKAGEAEPEVTDGGEEGACLTDEASNDGMDDRKAKKMAAASGKPDKLTQKGLKPARPVAPAAPSATSPYALQASSPALGSVVQSVPKSPQLKNIQPKPPPLADPASSPTLSKDKKKKDKKKREGGKEGDSPKAMAKGGRAEEGRSPYSDDALLNGSSEAHQSRLASIKAEADKVYSFSDNAPSPSIGVASRIETGLPAPLHLNQNGADNASVKTSSPAYSDISDAGEDGEGRAEVKVKTEPDQAPREGAKKALFPPQPPSKESPYYPNYDSYYSPSYPNPSPGAVPAAAPLVEGAQVKVKKEEEQPEVGEESKLKVEPQEERKPEPGPQQPSVIQQRSNMYTQPLYYNQYYVPPYSYSPDQAYHAHLLASNPAYRQQYEERQRQVDKKAEGKEREACGKEEWKQKALVPPTLSRAPSLTDLGAKGALNPTKPKEPPPASEQAKSVIMAKGEDPKVPAAQPEGLKMKLSEAGHHGKEEAKLGVESGRPAGVEAASTAVWYRQEPDSRLWPYVYHNKYSEAPKPQEEERWKDERERERDRKGKEERQRSKESLQKEEAKEGAEGRTQLPLEEHRGGGKESRPPHMQFSSPLAQHQGYMPYMHGPYAYSHGYEPSHPGYRGMPSVMMQNYPGPYLPPGYSYPSYGGKVSSGEEGEKPSRSSPTVKPPGEAKALDLLQQHASQYKANPRPSRTTRTPTTGERPRPGPGERPGQGPRRDREGDRPRSSPSQRILPIITWGTRCCRDSTTCPMPQALLLSHRRQSAGVRPVHVPART
ncbi:Zinc finger protein 609 [Larimichthys crocea]|uniref:Zinc finger protein 609 n=1 Tax=Larimichthys crocea TaxID=215358 RepID=A0A6G0IWU7_LARCR|nr:Zinc finger protein 609 [Larimichthys crocea]